MCSSDLWDYELGVREQAIQRVRELANNLSDYNWEVNETNKTYTGKVVSDLIIKALDGEK